MCDDNDINIIDKKIIKKFQHRTNELEKRVNKEFKVIEEEREKERQRQEEIKSNFQMWERTRTQTLIAYVSKLESHLSIILYSIKFTLRNIAVYLKNTAITKLKLLGYEENVKEFTEAYLKNLPFARMFIKELIKVDSVGLIICRRSENSIIKLVGRPHSPYIIVLNTPPLPPYQQTYACSWAVYKQEVGNEDIFIHGCEAECAGYSIIGSTTSVVLAVKTSDEVREFTLDVRSGNFIMRRKLLMSKYSPIYVFDDSKVREFSPKLQEWINQKKNSKEYKNWYSGQFILDMHRIVHFGGVYISPPESRKEQGKLRLVFDCIPMAYILEKMGGNCVNGMGTDFLRTIPMTTRDHSPFYAGSSGNVEEVHRVLTLP